MFFSLLAWEDTIQNSAISVLLNYLPSFFYFSCYFIVIMCWCKIKSFSVVNVFRAEVYHGQLSADSKLTSRRLQALLVVCIVKFQCFIKAEHKCCNVRWRCLYCCRVSLCKIYSFKRQRKSRNKRRYKRHACLRTCYCILHTHFESSSQSLCILFYPWHLRYMGYSFSEKCICKYPLLSLGHIKTCY